MKTTKKNFSLTALVLLLLFNLHVIHAQNNQVKPEFITVTKMHWDMNNENFDMDVWKSVEKEFMDKIIRKNENILFAGFFMHHFTADNTEILFVQSYPSWEAIGKANARNEELAKAAWPDEKARKAFTKKRDAYYANEHSDEIYATFSGEKLLAEKPTKDLMVYTRVSHFAYPDDGTEKEFEELNKQYLENVVYKNPFVKGYYPHVHAWGAAKTEFLEVFYLDSWDDIDDMLKKNGELLESFLPTEAKRKEFNKKMRKYFTGKHEDYIYKYISDI